MPFVGHIIGSIDHTVLWIAGVQIVALSITAVILYVVIRSLRMTTANVQEFRQRIDRGFKDTQNLIEAQGAQLNVAVNNVGISVRSNLDERRQRIEALTAELDALRRQANGKT